MIKGWPPWVLIAEPDVKRDAVQNAQGNIMTSRSSQHSLQLFDYGL